MTGTGRASPSAVEPARAGPAWPLVLLVVVAGGLLLDDVLDAAVIKRGTLAALCAVLVAPALGLLAREAVARWFSSAGGRWLVLACVPGLFGAFAVWPHAETADRLVGLALALVAAVAGLAAGSAVLGGALAAVASLSALVAGAQVLGLEQTLTTGPDEVVALAGNSTRAGALLSLAAVALAARALGPSSRAPEGGRSPPLTIALLVLVTAGLVLTRARGAAWLGLPVGLGAVFVATRRDATRRWRTVGLALVLGWLVGVLVGGEGTLTARKLAGQDSPLSGSDLTTNVRLALWSSSFDMLGERPLLGWGTGRFAAEFPPYRDPVEAALPGLAGAATTAFHPHNELLLGGVEGGLVGAGLLTLFLVLTLWRAARGHGGPIALGVLAAGTTLGLVQDAWTDPGTAIPFFAAAGVVWARPARADTPPAGPWAGVALAGLAIGAALLAAPRLHAHLLYRSSFLRTEEARGLTTESFALLSRAAEAAPGDVQLQRHLAAIGRLWAPRAPSPDEKVAAIQAIERAEQRIGVLAPHE